MVHRPMSFNQDSQPDSASPQRRQELQGSQQPPSVPATPHGPAHTSTNTPRPTSLRPPSVSVQPRIQNAYSPEASSRKPTSTHSPAITQPPAPLSNWGTYFFLLTMILTITVAWLVGPRLVEEYHYAAAIGKARGEYTNAVQQLDQAPLTEVSMAYQMVAQRIRPSVVSVKAFKSKDVGFGSGVILSADGYIMSNAHVIKGSNNFQVELYDRRSVNAKVIGVDNESDLAVLKIEADNLIPAVWGDSDAIEVGSMVWAIGSPYEFTQTITSGILSGKNRRGDSSHKKQTLLQTDAAVNPGNSGGPLVDIQGKVIGINTSIFGKTFQGISFAVPSSTAKFVFEQLVTNQKVSRGYLGLTPREITEQEAAKLSLPDLDGAFVNYVKPGGPAYNAGIRRGDILRAWEGVPIGNYRQLFRFAEGTSVGTEVTIDLWRANREGILTELPAKVRIGEQKIHTLWAWIDFLTMQTEKELDLGSYRRKVARRVGANATCHSAT